MFQLQIVQINREFNANSKCLLEHKRTQVLKMYKSLLASQVQVNKSHQVAFGGKGSHLAGREQRFGFD